MNMQDKVLESLMRQLNRNKNLHWVQQPDYANTGIVFIQRDFVNVMSMRYWFYSDHGHVTFYDGGDKPTGPGVEDVTFFYTDMASAMERIAKKIRSAV